MSHTSTPRKPGPPQLLAIEITIKKPGILISELARLVGPFHSLSYGWYAVNRALCSGLLSMQPNPSRRRSWLIFPTEKGIDWLYSEKGYSQKRTNIKERE